MFFFSSRRRHTRFDCDWSSDVCSSDLGVLRLVQDKEVPVYAAASVARVIEEIAEAKREQWSPIYGAEWPAKTYYPNSLLSDRAQVRFGELTFTVRELGPAESHADSYFLLAADGLAPVAFT